MERNVPVNLTHMSKDDTLHMETMQMSLDEARAFVDGTMEEWDDLDTCIDAAQAQVFDGTNEVAYVIIKIVK